MASVLTHTTPQTQAYAHTLPPPSPTLSLTRAHTQVIGVCIDPERTALVMELGIICFSEAGFVSVFLRSEEGGGGGWRGMVAAPA